MDEIHQLALLSLIADLRLGLDRQAEVIVQLRERIAQLEAEEEGRGR